jgi:uncharacterized protein YndB with AHSA1/START domain
MTSKRTVIAAEGQPTIEFTREFEADAARLFAAHVDPEQLCRWIGPHGTTCTVGDFDARTGGRWSYVVSAANGDSWAFFGSFHEVSAPTRLVQTWEFADEPGQVNLEVLTFTDLGDGRGRLHGLAVFLTVAQRDAMLTDMEDARDVDFERLDALLAEG